MEKANAEIRQAIKNHGFKHYQVATACGVSIYTFCHWLQVELSDKKKQRILEVIEGMKT